MIKKCKLVKIRTLLRFESGNTQPSTLRRDLLQYFHYFPQSRLFFLVVQKRGKLIKSTKKCKRITGYKTSRAVQLSYGESTFVRCILKACEWKEGFDLNLFDLRGRKNVDYCRIWLAEKSAASTKTLD